MRWAVNFRCQPSGEANYRFYLPSFVARSRNALVRELCDPNLWSKIWRCAFQFVLTSLCPFRRAREISTAKAGAIRAHWLAKVPKHVDRLCLGVEGKCPCRLNLY